MTAAVGQAAGVNGERYTRLTYKGLTLSQHSCEDLKCYFDIYASVRVNICQSL